VGQAQLRTKTLWTFANANATRAKSEGKSLSTRLASSPGQVDHAPCLPLPGPQATIAGVESFANSRMLHLHTEKSGMP
jgi:hypothetical protein